MSREQFIQNHPLEVEMSSRGVQFVGSGRRRVAKCPFHEDKAPSMSVDLDRGLWNCHAGCGGGSVIDFIARFDNLSIGDLLKDDGSSAPVVFKTNPKPATVKPDPITPPPVAGPKPTIAKIYSYQDQFGAEVFQAVRLQPKSFRQRHSVNGVWVWNMDGVERVLFRLPEITAATTIAVCEGEKDAETLTSLGFCGTCNVGGAGKWLDGYTESLAGKDVILFGDNDKPGQDHVKLVFESLAGKAKSVKIIKIPATYKDVTEYVESFAEPAEARSVLNNLVDEAHPFIKGISLPLFTMGEIESRYIRYAENMDSTSLDLGKWLPSFRGRVRNIIPGELVMIVGDTGVGKTGLLQSIALAALPLPTLMFEIELPAELLFERFAAMVTKTAARNIETAYASGDQIGPKALNHYFRNLFICTEPSLTTKQLEEMILRSELKIGERPRVVLLDYVQLMKGEGESRYDRASNVAESLKRIAKQTGTIIVAASQRGRPKAEVFEVCLHDAKESGSLENSSGLVLGVWRDPEDKTLLHVKILKNTKGTGGHCIPCNFDGETMTIKERIIL